MFKNKTVFILGAGASWHYGYPTGEELVKLVIKKAKELANFSSNYSQCYLRKNLRLDLYPEYIYVKANIPFKDADNSQHERAWQRFTDDCHNLVNRLEAVNPPVIDYFLDWNEPLRDIGQFVIAWVILECEATYRKKRGNINRKKTLENSPNIDIREQAKTLDIEKFNDNWYRFILNQLASGCKQAETLLSNDITFVTFNYDVSLENYLYKGLHAIDLFEKQGAIIEKFLNKNRVLHVYGKVRENPFENSKFGTLGDQNNYVEHIAEDFAKLPPDTDYNSVDRVYSDYCKSYHPYYREAFSMAYQSSKNLRTIGSTKNNDDAVIKAACGEIEKAKIIYILGYGFDELNSQRIGLDKYLNIINEREKSFVKKCVLFTNFNNSNRVNKKASMLFFGHTGAFSNSPSTHGKATNPPYLESSTRNVYEALELDFDSMETYKLLS
jgi:hypothetical protein